MPTLRSRLLREEAGFTLLELLSALVVTSVGVFALVTTLDNSSRLISFSEAKETAVHVAEQELEQLQTFEYGDLALDGQPLCGSPCNSKQPGYYADPDGWYRWDQDPTDDEARPVPRCELTLDGVAPITHCERLATGGSVPAEISTVETTAPGGRVRMTLKVQRFVTWVDDDCVAAVPALDLCVGDRDYKRVTVAVKVVAATEGNRLDGGDRLPILLSTVVTPR